jgi:HEAT repeat protein
VKALERRGLLRALAGGDENSRWHAATTLSQAQDPEPKTVKAVERILEGNGDDDARGAAAYVLGFSGGPDSASLLAQVLSDRDESPRVRAYAAEALGHLLQHEPVFAEVRTAVRTGLRDSEAEVRFWSAFAAAVLGLQETRPYLVHLADTDGAEIEGWWSVAEEAEWALRILNGEEDPPQPQRTAT